MPAEPWFPPAEAPKNEKVELPDRPAPEPPRPIKQTAQQAQLIPTKVSVSETKKVPAAQKIEIQTKADNTEKVETQQKPEKPQKPMKSAMQPERSIIINISPHTTQTSQLPKDTLINDTSKLPPAQKQDNSISESASGYSSSSSSSDEETSPKVSALEQKARSKQCKQEIIEQPNSIPPSPEHIVAQTSNNTAPSISGATSTLTPTPPTSSPIPVPSKAKIPGNPLFVLCVTV